MTEKRDFEFPSDYLRYHSESWHCPACGFRSKMTSDICERCDLEARKVNGTLNSESLDV
jgi:hypothetical protein